MIHDTHSAQISHSQKQDERNTYVIMKTICLHNDNNWERTFFPWFSCYYNNLQAIKGYIYIYIYVLYIYIYKHIYIIYIYIYTYILYGYIYYFYIYLYIIYLYIWYISKAKNETSVLFLHLFDAMSQKLGWDFLNISLIFCVFIFLNALFN